MDTSPHLIATYDDATSFLDARVGTGVKPGLERIAGLLELMGDPHRTYPIIHVAGTNGKTTTARMISDLLGAHGLTVGTFTSPHLQAVEERFHLSGRAMRPAELVQAVADVAPFVEVFEARSGESTTYFEVTAAIAFAAFADAAVDVAVVEVGLGGRWDATNVIEAETSVITGVSMDHMAWLGNSLAEIAAEKVAILKQGGVLVTAPLDGAAEGPVTARVAETGSRWYRASTDYRVESVEVESGGWRFDIDGLHDRYDDIELRLLGRHQVTNFATAVTAVEAFFGRGLDHLAVRAAAGAVTSPGRLEIVGRDPLVLLDGAHNEEAFIALGRTLEEEFPPDEWHLVIGVRGDRDAATLVGPIASRLAGVWATAAADSGAVPAEEVGAAIERVVEAPVMVEPTVGDAVASARAAAGPTGRVLVTGSLYVVGEARALFKPSGAGETDAAVFVHIEPDIQEADEEYGDLVDLMGDEELGDEFDA